MVISLSKVLYFHSFQIGAGTSLPGILASKLGAYVTLTDASHLQDCLNNCVKSCKANGIENIKVCGLTWGEFTPDIITMIPDIILASDCFYDTKGKADPH